MQVRFEINQWTDDAGVTSYRALLPCDVDTDTGQIDPSAPIGYGETAWEAIAALVELVDCNNPEPWLFMTPDEVAQLEHPPVAFGHWRR